MPKRWCRVERHGEQQGKPRGSEGILGIIEKPERTLGIIGKPERIRGETRNNRGYRGILGKIDVLSDAPLSAQKISAISQKSAKIRKNPPQFRRVSPCATRVYTGVRRESTKIRRNTKKTP
jgi:hypothetical protein